MYSVEKNVLCKNMNNEFMLGSPEQKIKKHALRIVSGFSYKAV